MRSISSFRAVYKKCTMRFLIVATAVLACALAAPQAVLAPGYTAPLPYSAPVARLTPAQPTISAGDINGAAIEAQVEVSDQLTAAADVNRLYNDRAAELQGQAVNNAEELAWREVDAVKTVEAKLDGAAASAAAVIAKNLVRKSGVGAYVAPVAPGAYVAPVPYTAPIVPASYTAPIASVYNSAAYDGYSAPLNYDRTL